MSMELRKPSSSGSFGARVDFCTTNENSLQNRGSHRSKVRKDTTHWYGCDLLVLVRVAIRMSNGEGGGATRGGGKSHCKAEPPTQSSPTPGRSC